MKILKKLQEKPRSTRLLILWLASFLVMVVIIIIWLFSFSRNIQFQKSEEEIKATNLPSLFESIEKDFSVLKQKLEGSIKEIQYEGQSEGQQ